MFACSLRSRWIALEAAYFVVARRRKACRLAPSTAARDLLDCSLRSRWIALDRCCRRSPTKARLTPPQHGGARSVFDCSLRSRWIALKPPTCRRSTTKSVGSLLRSTAARDPCLIARSARGGSRWEAAYFVVARRQRVGSLLRSTAARDPCLRHHFAIGGDVWRFVSEYRVEHLLTSNGRCLP